MADFYKVHWKKLSQLMLEFPVGYIVRIYPRELMLASDLAKPVPEIISMISIPQFEIIEKRPGLRQLKPYNAETRRIVSAWNKKYKDHSFEDFLR